jgi:hypothetical protein
MNKINIYILIFLVSIVLLFSSDLFAQFNMDCGMTGTSQNYERYTLNDFWGIMKPLRTDLSYGGEPPYNAYFPVLVVFVQFPDDPDLWPE